MEENKQWATFPIRETLFWRDGMTPEEYEKEREYYYKNMESVKNGTYKPLWKQKVKL